MTATITVAGRVFTGCATMRWDYELTALMPQIDACIAHSPETRWVTYAGETGPGDWLVRLRGGNTSVDCDISLGRSTPTITPRNEALQKASEGVVIFARGPGENAGGECYAAPEVRGANNVLLGWMIDPLGC